ncbi:MAG TPA: alpha-L-arabinofuranosidase C-terminal domain-containing protein, partial [Pirellulales bacterium]
TEEINHAYDGGLYAELIQNRIFKDPRGGGRGNRGGAAAADPNNPPHWSVVKLGGADGSIVLDTDNPVNKTALTTSLKLESKGSGGRIGVANDGFWGIPVQPNTEYKASFYAKASDSFKGPLKVAIVDNNGSIERASATVDGVDKDWKKFNVTLKTGKVEPSPDNRFVISAPGDNNGSIWFNLVSLFPPTYKNRANGMRVDIMEKLAGMQPEFLRFPGGNYLEGNGFEGRFNWKATIGPLEERPGHPCPWGYRSSDGVGLLEFLNWCEDLKMEPVLAVYAGFGLNASYVATGDQLKPFVQDALDEIEYTIGDKSTEWGARRAKDGHPEPFKLTYVEVGNEDNLGNGIRTYNERFGAFYKAIKEKYPKLQVISTVPPSARQPGGTNVTPKPDVADDHMYASFENTMRNASRHDRFPRDGVKIFMGEWATNGNGQGSPTPNLRSGLADAAFLGGLERNADVVVMECYAPLFVNVNPRAAQWSTNLIGYDAISSFGSPSYYVQKMFRENGGDRVLPVELKIPRIEKPAEPTPTPNPAPAQTAAARGRVGVGTWATHSEYKDMKVTNGDEVLFSATPENQKDWTFTGGDWKWKDGVLSQSTDEQNCRALVGDRNWTDYTYTVKARKVSGDEGFLIMFHARDDANWIWWNLGGWNNTTSAIQRAQGNGDAKMGADQNIKIETGRWYDIKIEVKGAQIRCYLDGELKAERTDAPAPATGRPQTPPAPMYATALRDTASGDVVLRVINTEKEPRSVKINLEGVANVAKDGTVEVLTGELLGMNSIDEPTKISPKKVKIDNAASSFTHEFPGNSLSIVRLKAK